MLGVRDTMISESIIGSPIQFPTKAIAFPDALRGKHPRDRLVQFISTNRLKPINVMELPVFVGWVRREINNGT
jgi:hypothetical protein